MYMSFYKLTEKPFERKPEPSFLWHGEKYKEALSTLRYGILDKKGFLLLTGEQGVGKTTLINTLVASLGAEIEYAVIDDPRLERIEFYNAIAGGFGLDKQFTSKVQFLIQFSHFLHKADDDGKKVVLLVDDCHYLNQEMLEELRLLSNIEKVETKLINIFFIGQPQFNDMLVLPGNRAVRQRLTLKAELQPLLLNETEEYIRHRLTVAGSEERLFSAKAVQAIQQFSGGILEKINEICEKCLSDGAARQLVTIDHKFVEECAKSLAPMAKAFGGGAFENIPVSPDGSQRGVRPADSAPKISGSVLSGIKGGKIVSRGLWKYAAAFLVVVTVAFLWAPWSKSPEPEVAMIDEVGQERAGKAGITDVDSSPVISMLDNDSETISAKKAVELKNAILEKAYRDSDSSIDLAGSEIVPAGKNMKRPELMDSSVTRQEKSGMPVSLQGDAAKDALAREVEQLRAEILALKQDAGSARQEIGGSETDSENGKVEVLKADAHKVAVLDPVALSPGQGETTDGAGASAEEMLEDANAFEALQPRRVILGLQPNSLKLTRDGRKSFVDFVEKLKLYPRATVLVKGFVSSKTNSPENIQLSKDRAVGVAKLLLEAGIDEEQLETVGMGNQDPIASNDTRSGRAKNRRVEIEVVSDGTQ